MNLDRAIPNGGDATERDCGEETELIDENNRFACVICRPEEKILRLKTLFHKSRSKP